ERTVRTRRDTHLTFADRLDALTTHRIWGTGIFLAVMGLMFQAIFLWAQIPMDLIDGLFVQLGDFVTNSMPPGELRSLVVDGVIAGVGSVVIFVPQIAVLFIFLGILEDTGYLSRAAYLMDRVLRAFGLQGRSFIPLLSSFACAIPGILATRTIPSWSDRMATIMVAPLMSCAARLPVYTVLIAAFIPSTLLFGFISLQGMALLSMYMLGIAGACIVAWLLKLTALRGQPALFVMEMPPFRAPSMRIVLRQTWDSVVSFLKNAGTIILACAIVLWFLASYPKQDERSDTPPVENSYAGQIGHAIEPLIRPLGYNWEVGVALLASFAAREVFVSSLATVYSLEAEDDSSASLVQRLQEKRSKGEFSTLSAVSLMVFYVFACQCMSTLAVCRRETGSWGWTAFMFVYMTSLAYVSALAVYQGGKLILGVQ
ncbi:MAG: ferrous iron transport protein B, partial [Deltaproteobacteria bacterium]|nr:ferrous iron transport protein B [Deltaproteobacteria bacterium]